MLTEAELVELERKAEETLQKIESRIEGAAAMVSCFEALSPEDYVAMLEDCR